MPETQNEEMVHGRVVASNSHRPLVFADIEDFQEYDLSIPLAYLQNDAFVSELWQLLKDMVEHAKNYNDEDTKPGEG